MKSVVKPILTVFGALLISGAAHASPTCHIYEDEETWRVAVYTPDGDRQVNAREIYESMGDNEAALQAFDNELVEKDYTEASGTEHDLKLNTTLHHRYSPDNHTCGLDCRNRNLIQKLHAPDGLQTPVDIKVYKAEAGSCEALRQAMKLLTTVCKGMDELADCPNSVSGGTEPASYDTNPVPATLPTRSPLAPVVAPAAAPHRGRS